MNRRNFIGAGLSAWLGLVFSKTPAVLAQPESRVRLSLQNGKIVNAEGITQVNFGANPTVTELRQQDEVWYAKLELPTQHSFWLKSSDGQVWRTIDWQAS